ncbi:TetR/AcrR family transcriptional regulator [Levilactobacillus acidifarinae]|uniref:Transcriptional regulator n=1 Tax=Levilactobacillus acidifarinae DSM 19394 = JCM 15949 TaxID=1423715 RepID=A0A0R1LQC9_9LACO|nr:TetR/AcrR family transcriptional regulator [Levilactobacillus acidifarinae]KRK95057.1 transcriptional regulator [Levilactobacillus acidifarinae DSM 19394]GEO70780.1 TetR family transcriptional regulator [Levilactobacillus acidifarinae]
MVKRRTLTREKVLVQANQLITEHGIDHLTIRELATALDVRPQSIYNYVSSLNDLVDQVGLDFVQRLGERLLEQLVGLAGNQALMVFAREMRRTCQQQPQLAMRLLNPSELADLTRTHAALVTLYRRMFASLHLEDHGQTRLAEVTLYRSALFGFIVQELGGFLRGTPAQLDQRFDQTMQLAIDQLPV